MRTIKFTVFMIAVLMFFAGCDSGTYYEVTVLNGEDTVEELLIRDGGVCTLPENPDKDMILVGWQINDDRENLKQPGDSVKISGTTVIRAVWNVPSAAFVSIKQVWSSIETVVLAAGDDVTVLYTTDGSDPVYNSREELRNGKIGREISLAGLSGAVTLKAVTVKGAGVSGVLRLDITVVEPPPCPELYGISDVMNRGDRITVDRIEGTTVRYTFDETVPTEETGFEGEEISLESIVGERVLTVVRIDAGGIISEPAVRTITVRPLKPEADISDGEEKGQKDRVSITAQKGCFIRYTLDGTEPGEESADIYDSPDGVRLRGQSGSVRLRAVAVAGGTVSEELTIDFYVKPAVAGFSAREGEVLEQERIVTASANDGDDIYYTLDGSDPKTSATRQSGSRISVAGCSGCTVIKAYAVADGIESDTVERRVLVKPAVPDISGVVAAEHNLRTDRITGITGPAGTVLRYTIDGSLPNRESREVPADGIPLSDTVSGESIIKISAEKDGICSRPAILTVMIYDYRLTYDLDGGTDRNGTTGEVWYNSGSSITIPGDGGITKDGWILDGWYTERNGQGTFYAPNSTPCINLSSDLTLYAHWVDSKVFFKNCETHYTVSAKSVSYTEGDIHIPAVYLGKPVVLKEGAFTGCMKITSIEFDENSTISVIPKKAFAETQIQTVINMPEVTEIGDMAFENCRTLAAFFKGENGCAVIPSGVALGTYVFSGAEAEEVEIKPGITEIPAGTFRESCIKKVRLPETVKVIGESAFAASEVEEVNLENVEEIRADAFNDANSLREAVLFGVKTMDRMAFYSCASLESVLIGSGIEAIDSTVFKHCTKAAIRVDRKQADSFIGREKAPWGAEGTSSLTWKPE